MTEKTKLIRVKRVSLAQHEDKKKKMEETVKFYTGKCPKLSWADYFDILAKQPLYIPEGVIIKNVKRVRKKFK